MTDDVLMVSWQMLPDAPIHTIYSAAPPMATDRYEPVPFDPADLLTPSMLHLYLWEFRSDWRMWHVALWTCARVLWRSIRPHRRARGKRAII